MNSPNQYVAHPEGFRDAITVLDRLSSSLPSCQSPSSPLFLASGITFALIEHRIRAHGGMDRRVFAVLLHEEISGAVDVEVGDHLCCTRLTAASASAAVMSGRTCWTA